MSEPSAMEWRLPELLGAVRARLQVAAGEKAGSPTQVDLPPRGEPLAKAFQLGRFEFQVLLLAAFAELEHDAASLMGRAQGDPALQTPSVALALSILDDAHWGGLAPDGALRRYELIELVGDGPTAYRTLRLPERVLQHLLGVDTIDASLLLLAQRIERSGELAPSRQQAGAALAKRLAPGPPEIESPVVQVCGNGRGDKLAVVAAAAADLGVRAFLVDADSLGMNPADRCVLARRWERENRLAGTLFVLDATDAVGTDGERQVSGVLEATRCPVVVIADEPVSLSHRASVRVDLPPSTMAERKGLWEDALGDVSARINGGIGRLANHFFLAPEAMAAVGRELDPARVLKLSAEELEVEVWNAARAQARPKLGSLAQRIESRALWKHLVLPEAQMQILKALAAQVRRRSIVYEKWGFAGRGARGLGISALFSGQSGTGKTLAAEVLGEALGLDVYRIDLSSVVSKWIGETEKNLRRIFDAAEEGCAVLLFDEADALFGKRADVKDSHDRYANIEVSYLLQRLEAYRGLAILTTNLKSNIDDAFLRRIRFVVEFPFPGTDERRKIWSSVFPEGTPRKGLDPDLLAQLSLTGGSIRSVAMNAAFLAAEEVVDDESEDDPPVTLAHVLKAVRFECEKTGRSLSPRELRGWPE